MARRDVVCCDEEGLGNGNYVTSMSSRVRHSSVGVDGVGVGEEMIINLKNCVLVRVSKGEVSGII